MIRFASFLVLFVLTTALSTTPAYAEPYLAIKEGVKCSACHLNPTGGGKRNNFGNIYSQTALSARLPKDLWTPDNDSRIKFGGNLRANIDSTFIPDQEDELAFELEEALLYAEIVLLKDQVSLYLDQRVGPGGALNREAYGLFQFSGGDYYAKVGRLFLPFGFRLEDDTSFVKQSTGINFDTPDNGVEVGVDFDKITASLAITNGTVGTAETDTDKQLSFSTAYVDTRWRIGASLNFNSNDANERSIAGVFGGIRTGPVAWLAELATIRDDFTGGGDQEQLATFAEANYAWRKGHNLKFTYEYLDPDQDIDENEQNRYSAIYEFFPIQFVQVIGGVRIGEGIPQSSSQNADEAFLQMHLYF